MSTTTTEPLTEAPNAGDDLEQEAPETPEGHLIDPAVYETEELALPKIDGEGVDRLALKFSGTVFLNRSDPRDVELIRRMRLGQDITLQVEGKCSKKGYGFSTDREGELDVVVQEHAVKIETVYQPVLEEA